MANTFVVNIPVSPYILKYATLRYSQPLRLDNSSLLGTVVYSLLSKPRFDSRTPLKDRNLQYSFYTQKLQCVAPISMLYDIGNGITDDHAIQINRFLEKDFEERMHIYVSKNIVEGKRRCGYYKAIEEFANHYNIIIDTDISLEGLIKIHYRYRKRQEKKLQKLTTGLSGQKGVFQQILL